MHVFMLYLVPILAIFGGVFWDMNRPRPRPGSLSVADLPMSIVPFDLRQRDHHVITHDDSVVLHCWPTNNLFGR